jgi:biotin carboxylase
MSTTLPTVWYNKGFSTTIHQVRALAGHAHTIASHTDGDTATLLVADRAFIEPKGLVGIEYLQYCLQICREFGVTMMVPSKENVLLARHQQAFSDIGVQLLHVAAPDTLKLLENKAKFSASFPRHICAIPETHAVNTWREFKKASKAIKKHYDVCFKPSYGVYGYGFRILVKQRRLSKFLAGDTITMTRREAKDLLSQHQHFPTMLVMQHLPGVERSVDAVAWRGELAAAVVRRKDGGLGVSNVQLLEEHPKIVEMVRQLTAYYQLSGIFNVQFREDKHGVPHILEINARASGGLRISMASGINFPLLMIQLASGEITTAEAPKPQLGLRLAEAKEVLLLGNVSSRPAQSQPGIVQSVYVQSVYVQPVYTQPVYAQPVYTQPVPVYQAALPEPESA